MRKTTFRRLSVGISALALVGGTAVAVSEPARAVPLTAPRSGVANLLNDSTLEGFIFKNVLGGVLQSVGGSGFGEVLSLIGFGGSSSAASAEQVKQINAKLDAVVSKLDSMDSKIDQLAASVNVTHQQLVAVSKKLDSVTMKLNLNRLTTLLNNAKPIVHEIDEDVRVLVGLAKGEYKDEYALEKRAQVIASLKQLVKQNALATLNEVVSAKSGGDDLLHLAFELEWDKQNRFWTNVDFQRANQIVDYYIDEGAVLTMLYAEYEYSVVTPSYSASAVASVRKEIEKKVVSEESFISTVQRRVPTFYSGNWTLDRSAVSGKYVAYKQSPENGTLNSTTSVTNTAVSVNWYDDQSDSAHYIFNHTLPTTTEWHHLFAGRGSAAPAKHLQQSGFTPALGCVSYGDAFDPKIKHKQATFPVYFASDYLSWRDHYARYWVDINGGGTYLNYSPDTARTFSMYSSTPFWDAGFGCVNITVVAREAHDTLAQYYTPRSTPRPATVTLPPEPVKQPARCTVAQVAKRLC
ncbi:MAG TPA: hypothetical protein VGL26_03880 [Jatrophihabitans sp.]|jgi:hypothetical protein